MRVTIIRDDNTVLVDGEAFTVDCSSLPTDFHALQWDGTSGEIEYRMIVCSHCNTRSRKPNLFVNDMTPYLPYVDAWTKAKKLAQEQIAEAARALAEVQAEAEAVKQAMHDAMTKAAFEASQKAAADAAG